TATVDRSEWKALAHQPPDRQGPRPHRAATATRPRRRGDRVSNCDLLAARSLIAFATSRLALRAPALRAATALTWPNRSARQLSCGRHAASNVAAGRPLAVLHCAPPHYPPTPASL